jgi:3-hydroxy-9,10-secoandrosta-1,3,5(10)-triene-9,17-dione monooxygenase
LPPFGPRFENADFQRWYGAAFVKLQTAEAAMMRCAELHMEACRRNAAGTEPYTWGVDARLAAIAREAMVQCWEAIEQHLFRTIGASAIRRGQRFERLFRDLATSAAHRNTQLRDDFWRQLGAIELGVPVPQPGRHLYRVPPTRRGRRPDAPAPLTSPRRARGRRGGLRSSNS